MSAGPGRGDHWQRPGAPQALSSAAIAAQIGASEARKSPVNDCSRDANSERRKASPSARSASQQPQGRASSPVLIATATAASVAGKGARSAARASHARSPVNAPRKSPVPGEMRNTGRSPPNRPLSRVSLAAEATRVATQPASATSSLGSEFLNMSPATFLREINPEIQDVLRADRGLQSEVEQQRECSVYPLMTSSTASFITVDNDSDSSDSDTQTEPLPYVKGTGLVHLEHDKGYTIAKIDTLPDETLEELIAQMSLALNRRKAVVHSLPLGGHLHSKSLPARISKPKDKPQAGAEHVLDKNFKFHKRPRSDPVQVSAANSKHMDMEVASITSEPHSGDEHDRWRDKRASGPHDKMFRSQFLLRDPENGHLSHVNYPNRRTVIDGCKQLRRVKPVAISSHVSTPDRERTVVSLTSPRSAFDDVSSQTSESSIPPPL